MKNIENMNREEAMNILKVFKKIVNAGEYTTAEDWQYTVTLMNKFGINADEI